jgi:hemerythrin-like domain-containing protein
MRYFDDAGANHHRDEEQDLFPALRRAVDTTRAPALEALIARVLQEHAALFARWSSVRAKLARIAGGEAAAFDAGEAEAFAEAYRRHVELEEKELFPLARETLGAEETRRLGEAMAERRKSPR